jgi:hypothetical protein
MEGPMPNQPNPNNPKVGWRVPKDVAEVVRDVAKERGIQPAEVVTRLVRKLGRRRLIGRPSVKSPTPSKRNRATGRAAS